MNIKNRIEKLESNQVNPDGFCSCRGLKPLTEISVYSAENKSLLDAEIISDDCENCGLKINKTTIIIQGVESEIPVPESVRL